MIPSGRPDFAFGAIYPAEETRRLEFKEIKGNRPVDIIANTADEYAVAFLNSEGGVILWGIEDASRRITGVTLSPSDRDLIRRKVSNKLREITPAIDPTGFRLELHPIPDAPSPDRYLVELTVPYVPRGDPFYTGGGDAFVRVDGANRKLKGPVLTEWIRQRSPATIAGDLDPKLQQHLRRVRQVFEAHDLQPTHWARFFQLTNAPFTVRLADIQDDRALLHWLDEQKLSWIADTFFIRREWLDGDSDCPQRGFHFDKDLKYFYETLSRYLADPVTRSTPDSPTAFFIRFGRDKHWRDLGNHGVFMVIRLPLARLSDELYVYRYLVDFQPYSWDYERTHVQFLAWIRLLFHVRHVYTHGCDIDYATGRGLFNEHGFLHPMVSDRAVVRTHIWHPDDYALFPPESQVSKATDYLQEAIDNLRKHNLPTGPADDRGPS